MESPVHDNIPTFLDYNHSLTCTYHRNSDIPCTYGLVVDQNKGDFNDLNFSNLLKSVNGKDKLVLWFYSNCRVGPRRDYANLLTKHGIKVDIYGKCGKRDPCDKEQKCLVSMYKRYKFYLAFENSYCYDYITEKVWKSLKYGMVPIVSGAPMESYNFHLPANSYLHVDNFSNAQDLSKYIIQLHYNNDLYLKYHEWRKHYVVIDDMNIQTTCSICKAIFQRKETKLPKKSKWWKFESHCKMKSNI